MIMEVEHCVACGTSPTVERCYHVVLFATTLATPSTTRLQNSLQNETNKSKCGHRQSRQKGDGTAAQLPFIDEREPKFSSRWRSQKLRFRRAARREHSATTLRVLLTQ